MSDEKQMELITVIVRRSRADATLEAALAADAPGITYYWARGTGVRKKLGFVGTLIEAEKLVLLIAVPIDQTDRIFGAVVKAVNLDRPGEGFAYVQRISRSVGFYPTEQTQNPAS